MKVALWTITNVCNAGERAVPTLARSPTFTTDNSSAQGRSIAGFILPDLRFRAGSDRVHTYNGALAAAEYRGNG